MIHARVQQAYLTRSMSNTPHTLVTTQTHSSDSALESDGEPDKPPSIVNLLNENSALLSIKRGFKRAGQKIDTSDDCAWLALHAHPGLVLTTDALIEGLHFDLTYDQYKQVGQQAAIVNLSDLASSGSKPIGLLWSLSLPDSIQATELEELSEGFALRCAQFATPICGGNLCFRPGPLEIHVSAFGIPFSSRGRITRTGAQVGDGIYVTGPLGARALGYLDPTPERRALRHKWRPHLHEARVLSEWGAVTAMMDISDGLLIDLDRLLQASNVGAHLQTNLLPYCQQSKALAHSDDELKEAALSGGEDYVLLFTSAQEPPTSIECVRIGTCLQALGLWVDGALSPPKGFLHRAFPSTFTTKSV